MHDFFYQNNLPAPTRALSQSNFTRYGKNGRHSAKLIGDGIYYRDFNTGEEHTWFPKSDNTLDSIVMRFSPIDK